MTNHDDERSVAYHGTKNEFLESISRQVTPMLKAGYRQKREYLMNRNKRSDTYEQKCGKGVYCTPKKAKS